MNATPYPSCVGRKFHPDGSVRRHPGNTVICHIRPQNPAFDAFVAAQATLADGVPNGRFTIMPASSLHMTVFDGVLDEIREGDRWPAHLAAADLATVTATFGDALRELHDVPDGFRMRPIAVAFLNGSGITALVEGATDEAEATIRAFRDRLAAALGTDRADHSSYGFHVTLGYHISWLEEREAEAVDRATAEATRVLLAEAPELVLGTARVLHVRRHVPLRAPVHRRGYPGDRSLRFGPSIEATGDPVPSLRVRRPDDQHGFLVRHIVALQARC